MDDDATTPPIQEIRDYRDYDVHLVIEDEHRDYLLKIGTVFERHSGELTGDSAHGTLVLTRLGREVEPDRLISYRHWQATRPPIHDGRPSV